MKYYDEKEKAFRVTASLNNFDGDVQKWKNAFYELWRYQMTWSYAYRIDVREGNSSGVFVDLLIREAYIDSLKDTMEDLGYRKINTEEVSVGIVDAFNHKLEDIEELVMDW